MDFHEIWYLSIFWKSFKNLQVSLKCDENNGYLHKYHYTFYIISHSVLLRMRNVADKSRRENWNTRYVEQLFLNHVIYEIMWTNILVLDRPQMTIWCALCAGYQRLQTRLKYVMLLFHCNSSCTNVPECYVHICCPPY